MRQVLPYSATLLVTTAVRMPRVDPPHEIDDDGAVEGVLGHAAEQFAGVEPDPGGGGVGGDLREGLAEAELAPFALVPRVVGVGVDGPNTSTISSSGSTPCAAGTSRWRGRASR